MIKESIRRSFSFKLSFWILLLAIPMFFASVGMLYWCGALVGSVTRNDFSVYREMAEVTSVYTFFTVFADSLTESLLIQFCRSALVTVSIITGPIVVRCVLAICS